MFHTVSSSTAMKLWRTRRRGLGTALIASTALAIAGGTVAVVGVASAGAKAAAPPLIVWIDTSRVPYEKAYMKANPHANIKWVIYNGNENGTGVLQAKFALWNRIGWPSSAPDVMFDSQNYDAVQLGTAPYNDLLNLKSYVPKNVLNGFAGTSMSSCTTPSGQIICLRNDSAADVLWVNTTLWAKYVGASVAPPTTWQGIIQDGQKYAKPNGLIVGDVGDEFDDAFIYAGNECPLDDVVGPNKVKIDPTNSNCTGINTVFDNSGLEGNAITYSYVFGSGGFPSAKVLMMVGPLWYGTAVFENGNKDPNGVPTGTMEAYPPPTALNGAKTTGFLGGGLWLVSKHAPNAKAAAAFAQYMATSPKIQTAGVDAGLPQYVSDQSSYLSALGSTFANPSASAAAWKTAAAETWKGWGPTPWSTDGAWDSTMVPSTTSGKPLSASINAFADALSSDAHLAGWTVVGPKCIQDSSC